MVFFAIKFDKFRFKVNTEIIEKFLQVIQMRFIKNPFPVFCYEDQMDMHVENTVSSRSNFV